MGLERPTRCLSVCVRWCKARPAAPKSHLADVCLLSFSGCLKQELSIKLDIRNLFLTIRVGLQGCSCLKNLPGGRIWLWVKQPLAKWDGVSSGWACLGARRWIEWACQDRKQELSDIAQCPSRTALSTLNVDYHTVWCFPRRLSIIQITCAAFLHTFFPKEVMLSSICCCLKLGLNVCSLTSTLKNTLNQLWIRSFSPAGRSQIWLWLQLFKPERLNLFVPLTTSQQCAPARKSESALGCTGCSISSLAPLVWWGFMYILLLTSPPRYKQNINKQESIALVHQNV